MLEAALDAPATRAAERPRHGRDEPERDASLATMRGRCAEDRGPDDGRRGRAPLERLGAGGIDGHDCEVAIAIDAGDDAALATTVDEAHGDLVTAQVVGIGQDDAIGDHDARTAGAAADADDGWADALGDGDDAGLDLVKDAHWSAGSPEGCGGCDRLVTCNLLLTDDRDNPRPAPYASNHGQTRP